MRPPVEATPMVSLGCVLLLMGAGSEHAKRVSRLASAGRLHSVAPARRRHAYRITGGLGRALVLFAGVAAISVGALGIAAVAVACGTGVLVLDRRRSRMLEQARRDAAEAVQLIGAELEAGASLPIALRAAAQVDAAHAGRLAADADAVEAGEAGDALLSCSEPILVAVGHACRIGASSGARLAPVFAAIAREASARQERRRAVAAALAGPRSSCVVLALLPVLGTVLGVAIGAHPEVFLLGAPAGRLVCCAGVVLDVLGLLWMRRIVERAGQS